MTCVLCVSLQTSTKYFVQQRARMLSSHNCQLEVGARILCIIYNIGYIDGTKDRFNDLILYRDVCAVLNTY